jgi:putative transposase
VEEVNRPQTEAGLAALRRSVDRGQPFGGERWVQKTAASSGLETTLRPRGRPKKQPNASKYK